MLVADNRAYDYTYEDYAYDLPAHDEQKKKSKKKVEKRRPKGQIFLLFMAFSFSIVMISHYAYIAEIAFNINRLEKEYAEIVKENSLLNVRLAETVNLQKLETLAQEELGMQYPNPDQLVYLDVKTPAKGNKQTDEGYFFREDVTENKHIARVKTLVVSLINLLER